jgi:hypothetical protein
MSSFSSGSKRTRRESSRRDRKASALSLVNASNRAPAIDMSLSGSVDTIVGVEIARSILRRPEVDTGRFFALVQASNMDINKSDAVIIVTACILEEVGSAHSAQGMLSKSSTVASMYSELGLGSSSTRKAFAILLFALNPGFVKLIESSVIQSLKRASLITRAENSGPSLNESIGILSRSGDIDPREVVSYSKNSPIAVSGPIDLMLTNLAAKSTLNSDSDSDTVLANDSVSVASKCSMLRRGSVFGEKSLMEAIKEKRLRGNHATQTRFHNSPDPVVIESRESRRGLRLSNESNMGKPKDSNPEITEAIDAMLEAASALRLNTINMTNRDIVSSPDSYHSRIPDVPSEVILSKESVVNAGRGARQRALSAYISDTEESPGHSAKYRNTSIADLL